MIEKYQNPSHEGPDKVLIKDIIIPAGTVFKTGPKERSFAVPHYECIIGLTKDTCGTFTYCLEDDQEKLAEYFEDLR